MSAGAHARRSSMRDLDRRVREPASQVLVTGPALNAGGVVVDAHTHCCIFDGQTGDGRTSPGPDGHIHAVRELDVVGVLGHHHAVSEQRCYRLHNTMTGHHVQARR